MQKNIKLSYVYNFFFSFNITSAIWVLYLSFRGINLVQIGLLESIFHLTSFLCEIPTGAIADIYGRKTSIIISRIFSFISTVLMICSDSFTGYAFSFVFSALSYNLHSGAAESIIYDSMKILNKEDQYKKTYGSISFYMEIARGLAILLGGILSDFRFVYAYILALFIDILALSSSTLYVEPNIEHKEHNENVFIHQLKESFKILNERKIALYLILFSSFISTIDTTVYFYCQKHFENISMTRTSIAIIYGITNVVGAISSKYAYIIEERLNKKTIIITLCILNIFILIGFSVFRGYFSIIIFLLSCMISGFTIPIFSDYINSLIPSQYRATILSFDSVCFSMFMLVLFPIVGLMAQSFGITRAFGIIGVLLIPIAGFIIYKMRD
ncbi:MFS transporter [Tepidibacter mesophilus]|uniref:MFS transporter n=1 Tax=Tepidibacter mesophilus TaxID=655607 RepID=UPI000C0836C9|nr:MFS transporter [Tepidibacter mesophilus]